MTVRAVDVTRSSSDADRVRSMVDREVRNLEVRQRQHQNVEKTRQAEEVRDSAPVTLREQVRRSSTVTGAVVDESA